MSSVGQTDSPLKPYIITQNIAHRILLKVEQVVRRDTEGQRFELVHEIYTRDGAPRIGYCRTLFSVDHGNERKQTSHLWDIPLMLDMRDGWEQYVEDKTLGAIRELLNG